MKRAIVDVDGTLWNFHKPLHVQLHRLYDFPNVPTSKITHWNWYFDYGITKSQFYKAVDIVHRSQRHYEPFKGVQQLFSHLDDAGYEVVIASHRRPQIAHILAQWIAEYDMCPYSALYAGPDKSQFFRRGDLLIDDAPHTIEDGLSLGMDVMYLEWPWNKGLGGFRFGTLMDMVDMLRNGRLV